MRNYWLRIALGAFGVFAIGMLLWNIGMAGKRRVRHIAESSDPITIPLALIPFTVDGQSLGTMRQVQIIRSEPEKIEAVNFRVRLADSISDAQLASCVLVMGASLKHIEAHHAFSCVPTSDTVGGNLAPVGEMKTQRGQTYVLFATAGALDSIEIDLDREMSDSIAAAHEAFGDSIRMAEEGRADSIRAAAERMADSMRARADSIIAANQAHIHDAQRQRARTRASETPEPPAPPAPAPKR